MQIALRERDLDAVRLQGGVQRPVIGGGHGNGLLGCLRVEPDDEFKVQRALIKFAQPDLWPLGAVEVKSERYGRGCFEGRLLHHVLVGTVGDPEWYAEAPQHVAVSPVHYAAGNKFGVRNQDVDVVVGDDRRSPDLDVAYLAGHAGFELDKIADLQRLINQQHDPRDKVAEERLQPKTQADPDGASEHSEVA